MPKVRPLTENERKNKQFSEQLAGKMRTSKITCQDLAKCLGISVVTLYRRRDNPETMTLGEIRKLKTVFPELVIE